MAGVDANDGPWAVVTGAAQGVGRAFAAELAAAGTDLLLLDKQEEALREVCRGLSEDHGVAAEAVVADLARPDLPNLLEERLAGRDVDVLVAAAGVTTVGPFLEADLDDRLHEIDVNVRATATLVHVIGRAMRRRGGGSIVLISSLSATTGTPVIANYAATKAYGWILGEGLWEELRRHGIDVVVARLGTTATPALEASGALLEDVSVPVSSPEEVAGEVLASLGDGPNVIPGAANRLSGVVVQRLLPRRTAVRMTGGVLRRMYPGGG